MINHTLHNYLKKRSTEELDSLLAYCLREANYANYEHVILEILRILNDHFVPDITSELALRAKEMLLCYKPKDR